MRPLGEALWAPDRPRHRLLLDDDNGNVIAGTVRTR